MLYVLIIKIDKLMKNFGYNLEHINLIHLNLHWKTLCIPNQITKKIKRSPKWTFIRLGIGFPRHLPRYSRVLAHQTYRAKLRSLSSTLASPGAPHMARARLQPRPAAGPHAPRYPAGSSSCRLSVVELLLGREAWMGRLRRRGWSGSSRKWIKKRLDFSLFR